MIDFKINKQGVYLSVNGEQVEQEVGTVLKLDSDVVPTFLAGKGEVIGDNEGKSLVTNDELLNSAIEENTALASNLESAKSAVEALTKDNKGLAELLDGVRSELKKAIDDLDSAKKDTESARELAIEHAKKLDAANAEIAELKKQKSK